MNVPEPREVANERLEPGTEPGGARLSLEASSVAGIKMLAAAVVVALASAALAWGVGDRFRVAETVLRDRRRGEGVFSGFAELSMAHAIRNGIVGYAIVGAILALGLGLAAGLLNGRGSIARAFLAGITGLVLGACGGAGTAYVLVPIYFGHLETADLTFSTLIHLGIWTVVGAASGLGFGIGLANWRVVAGCVIGGVTGAALGTLLFDIAGAFFPLAHTERPLPDEAATRLAAYLVLCLFVAVGTVVVASQKPRVKATQA
jgi:hypothetical protein